MSSPDTKYEQERRYKKIHQEEDEPSMKIAEKKELVMKVGGTAIMKYNPRIESITIHKEELDEEMKPFSKYIPTPDKLHEWVNMAYDEALLALLEENIAYKESCILGSNWRPPDEEIKKHAGNCKCIWISESFRKVCHKYNNLFETKHTGSSNQIIQFNLFEPEELRKKVMESLENARAYFANCLEMLRKREGEALFSGREEGSKIGLTYQEFVEERDLKFSQLKPFDTKRLEPIKQKLNEYIETITRQYEKISSLA